MKTLLLAVTLALPVAGVAQTASLPTGADPADRLAANLVVLAQNPRDVRALTEAGLSAVAVGDGAAALSFLGKAEALAPTDGRIKAGLGSALLLLEKPADAIRFFNEAAALGVPEAEIAADRGLAHDLRGDPRRAQRDYALALRRGPDDEITRRYALSLGISGDREGALELLDPLLRRQDLAAWRARAFILAMTGDVPGAEGLAQRIMPGGSGASMSPFLRRLATLDFANRAMAVNLGIMPSLGTQFASASPSLTPSGPSGLGSGLIPAGDPLGPRVEDALPRKVEPVSREPRRRPGRETVTLTPVRAANPVPEGRSEPLIAASVAKPSPPLLAARPNSPLLTATPAPTPGFTATPTSIKSNPPQAPVSDAAPSRQNSAIAVGGPPAASANPSTPPAARFVTPADQSASLVGPSAAPRPEPVAVAAVATQPPAAPEQSAAAVPETFSLASIVATLEKEPESAAGPLPDSDALRQARIAAQRKAAATAKAEADAKAAKAKKDAEAIAAKKSPARIWVQVATGANDAGLPLTWKRLREKAPGAFKGLSASSASFRSTNRLLVGPFKSAAEAKKTVTALSKAGISTFVFNSEAGQEIAKVASR